jgi:hypothetical protein
LALGSAHGRTQSQTANAAHTVDSDFHGQSFDGSGNVNVLNVPLLRDKTMTSLQPSPMVVVVPSQRWAFLTSRSHTNPFQSMNL